MYFSKNIPVLPRSLLPKLREALYVTDRDAHYNVTHDEQGQSILNPDGTPIKGRFSRGGPFGAMLAVTVGDKFELVGKRRGNNVVGSGIASRHAEDQALRPDNYEALTFRLSQLAEAGEKPFVWMISSGQSCTNCHTKQEIVARRLINKGLLAPGRFVTLYGATYDETLNIAQFYDAQYADAMIRFSRSPQSPDNLIKQEKIAYQDAPFAVQKILGEATTPTAVVMRNNQVYVVGREGRTTFDPFATAEVSAIRMACVKNRQAGEFASWGIDGVLYTTSSEIGSLLFAESGWTKIGIVKSVVMPDMMWEKQFDTVETPGMSNSEFLNIVASGYHDKGAAIRVVRDLQFKNTAQPKWAEILAVNNEQLYNGAAVSPAVEAMRDPYTRTRFAAHDLCTCCLPTKWLSMRAPQPLNKLACIPS